MRVTFAVVAAVVAATSPQSSCCQSQGPHPFNLLSPPPPVVCTTNPECNPGPNCSANNTCMDNATGGLCASSSCQCKYQVASGCQCYDTQIQSCTLPGPTTACSQGKQSCSGGFWSACQSTVSPESRDGCGAQDDQNCDGNMHNGPVPNSYCACVDGTPCANGSTCKGGQCGNAPAASCTVGPPCTIQFVKGECAKGTQTCPNGPNGAPGCNGNTSSVEICDGKDNDCNGTVDDIKTTRQVSINETAFQDFGGGFGASNNRVEGPADCVGTRIKPDVTKATASGDCGIVDWADIACQDPKRKVGHSDLQDACKAFFQQGGKAGPGNPNDCRYIVHDGVDAWQTVTCQPSHIVSQVERCGSR